MLHTKIANIISTVTIMFIMALTYTGCSENSINMPESKPPEISGMPKDSSISTQWKKFMEDNGVHGYEFLIKNYIKRYTDTNHTICMNDFHIQIVSGGTIAGYSGPMGWQPTIGNNDKNLDLITTVFPTCYNETLSFNLAFRFDSGSDKIIFNWQATRNGIVIFGRDNNTIFKNAKIR